MERKDYKKRFDEIHQFIIEIATGNFSFRLEPKDRQDEVETLVLLLNMMAEELRTIIHQINSEESTRCILQMGFIIDQNLKIWGYSDSAPVFLKASKKELMNSSFKHILSLNSGKEFQEKIVEIKKHKPSEIKVKLEFRSSDSLITPAEGCIHIFHSDFEKKMFLITAFKSMYHNKALEDILNSSPPKVGPAPRYPSENQIIRLESYRKLFKKLHFYINQNLDKPLPKLYEIAREMGASESKLKKGFRKIYGTTIFNHHREKRLEKAAMLITNTEQSIKQVSMDCGFISFPHFSRTFKERFGFSPSKLRNP